MTRKIARGLVAKIGPTLASSLSKMKSVFPQRVTVFYSIKSLEDIFLAAHWPKAAHEHVSVTRAVRSKKYA